MMHQKIFKIFNKTDLTKSNFAQPISPLLTKRLKTEFVKLNSFLIAPPSKQEMPEPNPITIEEVKNL